MYEISRESIEAATKCGKEKRCREDGSCGVACEAEYLLNDNMLFVRKATQEQCPYFFPYGNAGICSCPVRKELYKRYNM